MVKSEKKRDETLRVEAKRLKRLPSVKKLRFFRTSHITCRVFYEANKYSIHAEKDAIMKIKNKNILNKCNIYIGKIKNNKLELATPCNVCKNLLFKYNISKVCNFV